MIIVENQRPQRTTLSFRELKSESLAGKHCYNFATQATRIGVLRIRRCSQNFAHLFFHAAPMTRGALAELGFHFVFEVADYELGHTFASVIS
jgi:hypothetical protein